MAFNKHGIRKVSAHTPKLVESYCPGCELLIAASPFSWVLTLMEKLHRCPVYFRYGKSGEQRKAKRAA